MNRLSSIALGASTLVLSLMVSSCGRAPQLSADNIDTVLGHMTLREKMDDED